MTLGIVLICFLHTPIKKWYNNGTDLLYELTRRYKQICVCKKNFKVLKLKSMKPQSESSRLWQN